MKLYLSLCLCLSLPGILYAQDGDFSFGDLSGEEIYMTRYEKDTAADAVVLKEFGRTVIDNNQKNLLVHFYHVRIKILNDRGVDKANFSIPLHKSSNGGEQEEVHNIKGSTFNAGDEEARLKLKSIFTENKERYTDLVKFTLPNVKAGSVIEVEYTFSSPYIYNFREWEFQSDIPKIYSEYWARIPANLDYNISLMGFYKLTKDERKTEKDCLTTFNGGKADCALLKLGMKDIPAFEEEKYMTAKKNFLSAVRFELSAVHRFNGSTEKLSKTWKDVDRELHDSKDFGAQLKKGQSYFNHLFDTLFSQKAHETEKAKKIYTFLQKWYKWNGYTGILCESGIKKAFENRQGNIGDINLSLIAALRSAGLDACPVLVSTRDNGLPHDLYPVISDFNYVLARLRIRDSVYLLDASQPFLPFGIFPIQCVNGRGRALYNNKPSEWIPVTAPVIRRATYMADLTMDRQGKVTGTVTRTYGGYYALAKREEIQSFNSIEEYVADLNSHWSGIRVLKDSIANLNDPDEPLDEKMTISIPGNPDTAANTITFNPFFQSFIGDNPFKMTARHFPVDFGTQEKLNTILILHYPPDYHPVSLPKRTLLALPDEGGSYVLDKDNFGNTIIVKTAVQHNRAIYAAEEYAVLKEFYNRIIQSQRAELVFSRNEPVRNNP